MDLLKVLDAYSDLEQEIYLNQLDRLKEGVILKTRHSLKSNPRNILMMDYLFFSPYFSIRGSIYNSTRMLFEDDEIEVTDLSEDTYLIKLLNKGLSREKTETKSYIFETDFFVKKSWKEVVLHDLLNIDIITMSFTLQSKTFKDWNLFNEKNNYLFKRLTDLHGSIDQSMFGHENAVLRKVLSDYINQQNGCPPVHLGDAVFYTLGLKGIYNKKAVEKKLNDKWEFWDQKEITILE